MNDKRRNFLINYHAELYYKMYRAERVLFGVARMTTLQYVKKNRVRFDAKVKELGFG